MCQSILGLGDTGKQGQHCLYPYGVYNEQQIASVKSVKKIKDPMEHLI